MNPPLVVNVVTSSYTALSEGEILAQSLLFFLAGYDTTSMAISFLCYNLAVHTDCQDKLIEEIDSVMQGHVSHVESCNGISCIRHNETVKLRPDFESRTFDNVVGKATCSIRISVGAQL